MMDSGDLRRREGGRLAFGDSLRVGRHSEPPPNGTNPGMSIHFARSFKGDWLRASATSDKWWERSIDFGRSSADMVVGGANAETVSADGFICMLGWSPVIRLGLMETPHAENDSSPNALQEYSKAHSSHWVQGMVALRGLL